MSTGTEKQAILAIRLTLSLSNGREVFDYIDTKGMELSNTDIINRVAKQIAIITQTNPPHVDGNTRGFTRVVTSHPGVEPVQIEWIRPEKIVSVSYAILYPTNGHNVSFV